MQLILCVTLANQLCDNIFGIALLYAHIEKILLF